MSHAAGFHCHTFAHTKKEATIKTITISPKRTRKKKEKQNGMKTNK